SDPPLHLRCKRHQRFGSSFCASRQPAGAPSWAIPPTTAPGSRLTTGPKGSDGKRSSIGARSRWLTEHKRPNHHRWASPVHLIVSRDRGTVPAPRRASGVRGFSTLIAPAVASSTPGRQEGRWLG